MDDLNLADLHKRAEADEWRDLGDERHAAGDLDDAAAYYQMSLDLFPTAEAHTALAVALAARANWDAAIENCRQAVALDPELGNPYNDMAVYLIEKNELSEALQWLDRALQAPRYDSRHFSHYHRGRILERMARFGEARSAFGQAVKMAPDWEPAQNAYLRVLGWLN